jgi:hypothetical protein
MPAPAFATLTIDELARLRRSPRRRRPEPHPRLPRRRRPHRPAREHGALGWWWPDPAIALGIAVMAIHEGRETWKGDEGEET